MTTLHLLGLPHTQLTWDYVACAYSGKILRLSSMLTDLGHKVYLYAGEETDARCEELVTVVTVEDRAEWFPDYDFGTQVWNGFDVDAIHWRTMNDRAIVAIRQRIGPGDIIGVTAGWCQKQVADAFPDHLICEVGVGYLGVFAPFRVFESQAWRNFLAAKEPTDDLRWFDCVIANSYEDHEFSPSYTPGDYLLYLGRMTPRKGLPVVQEITRRTGLPVFTAGQGDERIDGATHLGMIRGKEKADLLAGARAVMVPTTYLEPFGGVAVEAQLSGTPVITTNHAVFCETVEHGLTGFRCDMLDEFMTAVDRVADLDRHIVRRVAAAKYLTSVTGPQYETYFERLGTLHGDGWYEGRMI